MKYFNKLMVFFCYFSLILQLFSCSNDCQKSYTLARISSPPKIDGVFENQEWREATLLQDFTFPWQKELAPATVFHAQMDETNLYFIYQVKDNDIVMEDTIHHEMEVVMEDRVELFFAPDRSLKTYYCFEIDPLGRALDNSGALGQKINENWNCPGTKFKGTVSKEGYTVEGLIPLSSLSELGIYKPGKCFLVGLYRAEFSQNGTKTPKMEWISWIIPDSPTPNFHIPSSFGCFCE